MENLEIEEIKKQYSELSEKYKLPGFQELAEDFDIEKIAEKETSFLLREIRRAIGEKLSAYLQLFEALINPATPQIFIFSILKNITEEDRKNIARIYRKIAKIQIKIMELDTIYDEKQEAQFIKQTYEEWQKLKTKVHSILQDFDKKFEESNNSTKKGYFG